MNYTIDYWRKILKKEEKKKIIYLTKMLINTIIKYEIFKNKIISYIIITTKNSVQTI